MISQNGAITTADEHEKDVRVKLVNDVHKISDHLSLSKCLIYYHH